MPRVPSAEQRTAVRSRRGFFRTVAVPGSGKTTVFVDRVKELLNEVPAQKILAVTFTKEGALEMEERSGIEHVPGKYRIFRTFHGWALDFICREVDSLPYPAEHWPLLTPLEGSRILSKICRRYDGDVKYRDAQSFISNMKRKGLTPEECIEKAEGSLGPLYARVYRDYERACRTAGQNGKAVMDFDSCMIESVKLLENRPDVRARNCPEYLMIDEAQDTDVVQWRLVQILASRGNLFAVGDPRQNMYTWRGSEAAGLLDMFAERFPGATTLPLSINYRSTGAIVKYLNEIDPYKDAGFPPIAAAREYGVDPDFTRYPNSYEEAKGICKNILDKENTAILCRTNRQLQAFERCCGEMDIKYRLLGKSGFFNQEEVKAVTDLIKYCFNPSDKCVERIIKGPYEPTKFLRKKEVVDRLHEMQRQSIGNVPLARLLGQFTFNDSNQQRAVRDLHDRLQRMRAAATKGTARDGLKVVLDMFHVLDHYCDGEAVDNNPLDNIRSLESMAGSKPTLMDLLTTILRALAAARGKKGRVTLSTIHQSKGKEWKHVFVAGVDYDMLPHKNGELEEEKRIYFVAASRAADRLHVSCTMPSPFIKNKTVAPSNDLMNPDLLMQMYELANEASK